MRRPVVAAAILLGVASCAAEGGSVGEGGGSSCPASCWSAASVDQGAGGTGGEGGARGNENALCPDDTFRGDYTMENDASVAALAGCTRISGDLLAWRAKELTQVCLPDLVSIGGGLGLDENPALSCLGLPALSSLAVDFPGHGIDIRDNPLLPTCAAAAIRDQLLAAGYSGGVLISGNGAIGTCP